MGFAAVYKIFEPKIFQPSSEQPQETVSPIEKYLQLFKSYNDPILIGLVGASWGKFTPPIQQLNSHLHEGLSLVKKPCFIASFLIDMISFKRWSLGAQLDVKEKIQLFSSLITRGCKVVCWVEKYGLAPLSDVALWRLKAIGNLSSVVRTTSKLMTALFGGESAWTVLNISTKLLIPLLSLYGLFYASSLIKISQLLLATANIGLTSLGY